MCTFRGPLTWCAAIIFSMHSSASSADSGAESADQALTVSIESIGVESRWSITVDVGSLDASSASAQNEWNVEVFASERTIFAGSVDGTTIEIEVDGAQISPGEHLMIAVRASGPDSESPLEYAYFKREVGGLVAESLEDYLVGRSVATSNGLVFVGGAGTIPQNPAYVHLAPWDNPDVRPEDRKWSLDHATSVVSSALQVSRSETVMQPEEAGCSSGSGGALPSVLAMVALLPLMRRRNKLAGLLIAVGFVSAATQSKATVVYGYVAFWDSRQGSHANGTRLDTCDPNNVTCAPDSYNCCIRSIPLVDVSIYRNSTPPTLLATVQANGNGYFEFPGTVGYQKGSTFFVSVTFSRTEPVTSQIITVNSSGSTPFSIRAGSDFSTPTGSYFSLPARIVNSVQPPDTSSQEGNIATAWHALTWSFLYMEGDAEYRQKKVLGSSNTYDQMVFRYRNSATSTCPSNFWLPSADCRTMRPHEVAGYALLGRVAGCASSYFGNAIPAWPRIYWMQTEPNNNSTGEGAALNFGIRKLIALMSRFGPAFANITSVKAATFDCFDEMSHPTPPANPVDLYPQSNSAAWAANNALALWDLIDADTSDTDESLSDSVDTNLNVLMNAVAANFAAAGPQGANHTENEFHGTDNAAPDDCQSNEGCDVHGAACFLDVQKCFSPHPTNAHANPHAGNIGDLAYYMPSGIGNVLDTIKSSKCMKGGADDSHQFTGAFRDN